MDCSVPEDKDFLALQGVLSLVDMLGEILSIVRNLSPQIVDQEWLSEVVFVIGVRHGLEVERHGSTALNVSNLVLASGSVAVSVEELGEGLAVLGEERVIESLFPLLIEVHHVIGLRGEETAKFLVLEDVIKNVNLVNGRLSTLISDPGSSDESGGDEMNFPERGMREHQP